MQARNGKHAPLMLRTCLCARRPSPRSAALSPLRWSAKDFVNTSVQWLGPGPLVLVLTSNLRSGPAKAPVPTTTHHQRPGPHLRNGPGSHLCRGPAEALVRPGHDAELAVEPTCHAYIRSAHHVALKCAAGEVHGAMEKEVERPQHDASDTTLSTREESPLYLNLSGPLKKIASDPGVRLNP